MATTIDETRSDGIIYAGLATITKARRRGDGTLEFEASKATDSTVDLDQQVVDPSWAKAAMEEWFRTGGNLRENHQAIAAGRALELEHRDDGEYITGLVVDPVSVLKVETGVLQGLSIGIKRPRVIKDADAPGGRIVSGTIVECSLTDRPANPACKLVLAKAAVVDGSAEFVEELHELTKREVSQADRERLLEEGNAMRTADGAIAYPVDGVADLRDAIRAYGRANQEDRAKVRSFLKRRARELSREDLIPAGWKMTEGEKLAAAILIASPSTLRAELRKAQESGALRDARVAIAQLIVREAAEIPDGEDETACIGALLDALRCLSLYASMERAEGESEVEPAMDPAAAVVDGALQTVPLPGQTLEPAMSLAALAEMTKSVQALQARLDKVENMAAPGGPARMRVPSYRHPPASRPVPGEAERFRQLSKTLTDPKMREGYLRLAEEAEKAAAANPPEPEPWRPWFGAA